MSTRKTLLLVDGDTRSLRVLEVSLRKAGFTVNTAESSAHALHWAFTEPPDLVIADTHLPDGSGFDLCQRLRSDNRTRHAVVVFLTEEASPETKIAGINAGADDFLTKPVLVKEIVSRVKTLLEKRRTDSLARRERPGNLSGTLSNMGVVDLLQVMETGKKSGIVHLSSDPIKSGGFVTEGEERGTIFFRDGEVIDAKLGRLTGLAAVYRMLLWDDGVFEIEFKAIARDNTINTTTQAILLEGMRRVDEWSRFSDLIPPVNARLIVDYGSLARAYPDVPTDMRPVLHLFDGKRTVFEVVSDSAGDDAVALSVIADLHRFGILTPANRGGAEAAVEQWLSSVPSEPADLPSALGNAMIPSPDSASTLMRAASLDEDDRSREETLVGQEAYVRRGAARTELPIPLAEPSHILSRHTVPANRALPLTSPVEAPIPLTETRVPRLQIQRVSSVVGRLPTALPAPTAEAPVLEFEDDDGWDPIETAPSPTNLRPKIVPAKVAAPKITSGPALASAEPPAKSEPAPRAKSAPYTLAAAAAPAWPPPERAKAPPPDAAPTKKPVPREQPAAAPPTAAPAKQAEPKAPEESPANTGEWYNKSGGEDVLWEGESHPWRARLPGIALVASVVMVLVVLLAGGREPHNVPPSEAPPAPKAKRADWPATDDRAIVIKEDPTKGPDPTQVEPRLDPAAVDPTLAAPAVSPPAAMADPQKALDPANAPLEAPPFEPAKVGSAKIEPAKIEPAKIEPAKIEPPKVDPPKADPIASKATLEKAEAALAGGSLRSASAQFKKAIAEDGKNAEAYSGLAMVYVEMGQDRSARKEALHALELDGKQARAHLVLALIAANGSEMDKAKKSYQRYLELAPNGKHAAEVRRILETLQ